MPYYHAEHEGDIITFALPLEDGSTDQAEEGSGQAEIETNNNQQENEEENKEEKTIDLMEMHSDHAGWKTMRRLTMFHSNPTARRTQTGDLQ
ncbi:MAG: hypothetical protein ACRDL7_16165 [Gaiellaceae bacterium]